MGGHAVAGIPLGSDFNGWVKQGPRGNGELKYSFEINGVEFKELRAGGKRFDYNTDGLANMGLLPDFAHHLRSKVLTEEQAAPLFRGAEAFIRAWERMEAVADGGGAP